jgi:hypothetical protein
VLFKADVDNHEGFRIVRLAGRLQCEHVDELMRLCEESTPVLRLDLTDLVSVDPSGLETLSVMQQRGAQVEGASPYIALQLERVRPARDRASGANRRGSTNPRREPGNCASNKENL